MKTVLWWVRRDMRLGDNQALFAALAKAEAIVPIYVLDEQLSVSAQAGGEPYSFLLGGLQALDRDLRGLDSRLIVRRGNPREQLADVLAETGAVGVFAEREHTPYGRRRDNDVGESLPLTLTEGWTIHPAHLLYATSGKPGMDWDAFSRTWKQQPLPKVRDVLLPPERLSPPPAVSSLPIPVAPRISSLDELLPGETAARRRLRAFVDGENGGLGAIYRLEDVRSQPESSALADSGPYLSLGMLSIRQAVVSAVSAMEAAPDEEARRSAELWLDALIQRDFAATRQYAHEYGGQSVAATEPGDIDWWNEPEIARTGASLLTHGIVAEEAKRRMQAGQVADSTRSFDRGEMT